MLSKSYNKSYPLETANDTAFIYGVKAAVIVDANPPRLNPNRYTGPGLFGIRYLIQVIIYTIEFSNMLRTLYLSAS